MDYMPQVDVRFASPSGRKREQRKSGEDCVRRRDSMCVLDTLHQAEVGTRIQVTLFNSTDSLSSLKSSSLSFSGTFMFMLLATYSSSGGSDFSQIYSGADQIH